MSRRDPWCRSLLHSSHTQTGRICCRHCSEESGAEEGGLRGSASSACAHTTDHPCSVVRLPPQVQLVAHAATSIGADTSKFSTAPKSSMRNTHRQNRRNEYDVHQVSVVLREGALIGRESIRDLWASEYIHILSEFRCLVRVAADWFVRCGLCCSTLSRIYERAALKDLPKCGHMAACGLEVLVQYD